MGFWLCLFSPGLDKLSLKSIKCVFVGYSKTQKDYHCYNLATRRYITVTNVTFSKSMSFFASSSSPESSITVPLPEPVKAS